MSYSMNGGKSPGSSGNQTGTGLPPSLVSWVDDLENINWAQIGKNLKAERAKSKAAREERRGTKEERENLPFKGAKKTRFFNNKPKNAKENAEFIKAGGGSRPAFD